MGMQDLSVAYVTFQQARKNGALPEILKAIYKQTMNAMTNGSIPSEKLLKKKKNKNASPVLLTTSQGIAEGAFRDSLEGVSEYCLTNGILFGIPTGEEGVMIGDIAEVCGLDYKGATAKRIKRINTMIHQAAGQ